MMDRALVLSGGGALGAIEAGFIDVARSFGVRFPCVAGASAGAINAAAIAFGVDALGPLWADMLSSGKLEDWVSPVPGKVGRLLGLVSSYRSLIKGEAIRAALVKQLGDARMGDARSHLKLVTFNKSRRCVRIVDSANEDDARIFAVDALMTSIAVPFIFPQQQLRRDDPTGFCDGGLVKNVPATAWDDRPDLRTLVLRFKGDESPRKVDTLGEDVEAVFDGMRDASEDERSSKPSTEEVILEGTGKALSFNQTRAEAERMVRAGGFAAKAWLAGVARGAAA